MDKQEFSAFLKQYPQALTTETMLSAHLHDCFPKEKGYARLLLETYRLGIVTEIERQGVLDTVLVNRMVTELTDEYFYEQTRAQEIVALWVEGYGVEVLGKATKNGKTEEPSKGETTFEKKEKPKKTPASSIEQKLSTEKEKTVGKLKAGDVIQYGRYPQDENGEVKPIEWLVLKVDGATAIVISRYGLDAIAFSHETPYPTWEKSDIREWLNSAFLNKAFTEQEQKSIFTASITTPSFKGISGGSDTQDKLWLLSGEEAKEWFAADEERKTRPTAYAKANGALAFNGGGWWLRSPGKRSNHAAYLKNKGTIGSRDVGNTSNVVRPAFLLDLALAEVIRVERQDQIQKEAVSAKDQKTLTENEIAVSQIKIGYIIRYGRYPQGKKGAVQPIDWLVLKVDGTVATVISKYGLEARIFHHRGPYPTWKKSDIREWLNSEFLNKAFTKQEQETIITASITTPSFQGISGGSDTRDKLWLLSRDEAIEWFATKRKRKTRPTDYAKANGAFEDKLKGCLWWLRSPGNDSDCASRVNCGGSLSDYSVSYTNSVIRPAFLINLAFVK